MRSSKNILITGGSGMIGGRLTEFLIKDGFVVTHLGRSRKNSSSVKTFLWDPAKNEIEASAVCDVDAIIHLAGAGIADKRWNESRKQEILLSRTQSTRLLVRTLAEANHRVKTFISASGISYYGLHNPIGDAFIEDDPAASDFMAGVAAAWEKEVESLNVTSIRTVIVRTGVVLSKSGGALEKLVTPIKFFVGAPLGSGAQYVNWIHLDDLCRIYLKAIEDTSMRGPYNAVAPQPITNRELTKEIAQVLGKPLWLPPIPAFIVKVVAGEVAEVVLKGGKISPEKIQRAGFKFKFSNAGDALADLLRTTSR